MYTFLEQDIFKLIKQCCANLNVEAYAIGGFVRDIFLQRESKDIDIVTLGRGIDLAEELHKLLGEE